MSLPEGWDQTQTIAAISTPAGMGGIGVIRLSGSRAHAITKKIFSPRYSSSLRHRKMVLGDIVDPQTGVLIDEAFVVLMVPPHTYTREPMAEIQCHSGRVVLEKILRLLIREGTRLAAPGEFTLRAFLNGRIDLTEAESVIEIIQAQSEAALQLAQKQLHGGVRKTIMPLIEEIDQILTYIEADLDFSEDLGVDFTPTWKTFWEKAAPQLFHTLGHLMENFTTCQMVREGFKMVILGAPNVGKSSILNRFLGKERAIVTEFPGTTRDFIEEGLLIQGLPFRVIDTAGLRETEDPVEKIGTRQALSMKKEADIVLLVFDGSRPLSPQDTIIFQQIDPQKTLLLINKIDLPQKITPSTLATHTKEKLPTLEISAKTGQNWDQLLSLIVQSVQHSHSTQEVDSLIPINQRHHQLLEKAKEALERFQEGLQNDIEEVFLAQDLWEAKRALEAIIGKQTDDTILSQIFQNFCIGK